MSAFELEFSTTLPEWLDTFIFDELGANYAPDFVRYEFNLDLTKEEVKTYLGTYFPRSYTESYCIFDNLFSNPNYYSIMQQKSVISILDFGSGTGGEIIGLLTILSKYLPDLKEITVLAIDGNHDALRFSNRIIEQFTLHCPFPITYNVGPISISDCSDVDIIAEIVQNSFDFILSFKAICELISKQRITGNAYQYVADILSPKLTDTGLITLLDVTVKNEVIGTYYPIHMNEGVRNFMNESELFKTLIPLPCHMFEDCCTHLCFTQRIFKVSHSRRINDISKVSYRIMGRKEFVMSIIPKFDNAKFIIQKKNGINSYCPYSYGVKEINSFNINI